MTDEELELFPTSESAAKMLSYVTQGFYDKSYVGKWLYQVMGLEYDDMQTLVEELPDQMFPESATWGLKYHEIKWGLPVRENLSYEERRKLIYQKRDYRAPMTPYRMENTLADATGFAVYIADIHDPGELNYVPEHPNVFMVYFTGEGTLDTATAYKMLDEIKQSHTTYMINQYTAVVLDCTTLEEFTNFTLRLALAINFWDSPMLNGAYYLDGSLLLDAYRRWDMKVGLKYEQGDFEVSEEMDLVKMLLALTTETDEAFGGTTAVTIGNVIKFYDCLQLDGEVLLDGSELLDSIRQEIPVTLSMATAIPITEEFGNATLTTTRNLAYLNGSKRLNGTTLLNSYQGKEDL